MLLDIQDFEYFRAYARLDELKKYLDITEKYLQEAKDDFQTWADEKAKKLSPGERNEFYEFYSDNYWQLSEKFPRILRNSFLVSAHSLLEYEMNLICRRLKKERQIQISWNDLRGDVLERAKLYCKLARLDLPYNDKTWQEINHYSKVRNCIIHKNGLLKEFQNDQDLIAYVTKKGIISQDTIEQEIALTEQFCAEVIETIQAYLEKLYKALVKK